MEPANLVSRHGCMWFFGSSLCCRSPSRFLLRSELIAPNLKNSPAISTAKLKSALPPRPLSSNPLKRKLSMEPANLVSSFPLSIIFSGVGFLVSRLRSQADKSGGFFFSLVWISHIPSWQGLPFSLPSVLSLIHFHFSGVIPLLKPRTFSCLRASPFRNHVGFMVCSVRYCLRVPDQPQALFFCNTLTSIHQKFTIYFSSWQLNKGEAWWDCCFRFLL